MARKNEVIAVYVAPNVKAAIERIAEDDERTVAALMRKMVHQYLRDRTATPKTRKRNATAA